MICRYLSIRLNLGNNHPMNHPEKCRIRWATMDRLYREVTNYIEAN